MSWYCGSQLTTMEEVSAWRAEMIVSMLQWRLEMAIMTPLGKEVLPDVYWRKQRDDGGKERAGSSKEGRSTPRHGTCWNFAGRKVRHIAVRAAPGYRRPLAADSREHVFQVGELFDSQIFATLD